MIEAPSILSIAKPQVVTGILVNIFFNSGTFCKTSNKGFILSGWLTSFTFFVKSASDLQYLQAKIIVLPAVVTTISPMCFQKLSDGDRNIHALKRFNPRVSRSKRKDSRGLFSKCWSVYKWLIILVEIFGIIFMWLGKFRAYNWRKFKRLIKKQ